MNDIIFSLLDHLFASLKITLTQIFILAGPGLILAIAMNFAAGRVEISAYRLLGRRGYLWAFGWLGTIVHELGHAVMCIFFRHQINRVEFFNPNPSSETLGYVDHSYNRNSTYQTVGNFFIGMGPIILGALVIFLSARYLISETFFVPFSDLKINYQNFQSTEAIKQLLINLWNSFIMLLSDTFTMASLKRWQNYLFFYILFCVGSSMTLSRQDIRSAGYGFFIFSSLLFLFNIIALLLGGISSSYFSSATRFYSVFYAVMFFALLMNLLLMIPLYLLRGAAAIIRNT